MHNKTLFDHFEKLLPTHNNNNSHRSSIRTV